MCAVVKTWDKDVTPPKSPLKQVFTHSDLADLISILVLGFIFLASGIQGLSELPQKIQFIIF